MYQLVPAAKRRIHERSRPAITVHGIPAEHIADVHKLRTRLGRAGQTVEPKDSGVPTL